MVTAFASYSILTTLVDYLDRGLLTDAEVIPWSCPVPYFGDFSSPLVATLGINPSNREFIDKSGKELQGPYRRFPTLASLGLRSWCDADARHLNSILDTCGLYFFGNPYNSWFKRLDTVVGGANASYYDSSHAACHFDLVPYATGRKWTELSEHQRSLLLSFTGDALGRLLSASPVRLLILNGSSVVRQFQSFTGCELHRQEVPAWSLTRLSKTKVPGVAYQGTIHSFAGHTLRNAILVLGYNHNLQSSFGVTTQVVHSIRDWIAQTTEEGQW